MRSALTFVGVALCMWGLGVGLAQGQAIPTAPPPVPPVPPVPAAPAAPQPFNIWTMLCPPPGTGEKCKKHLCESFVGQMLGSMLKPVRMMSGGMMKPCCPTANMPNPEDLKKDATSAAGAAARIKQEEMEAKARRADVRFLGTVDCSRYPEAEQALIKALRTDRNECVRFEAALALGSGCCCTRGTIEALMLTVNGSDKDENPVENSMRVRQAAAHALANCQARAIDQPITPPERPAPLPPLPESKQLPPGLGRETDLPPPRVLPVSFAVPAPPVGYNTTGFPIRPLAEPENAGVPTGQRGLLQIFMRRAQAN